MATIEQLLGAGDVFHVDSVACMQHAEILKSYRPQLKTEFWFENPKATQLIFKVAFISVCHQFNWDFMQRTLAEHLLKSPDDILLALENITAPKLAAWLSGYHRQERIRAKERADLLRDIAKVLRESYGGDLRVFFDECANAKLDSGDFHQIMDQFKSYRSDPLRKKTNILSHDLVRERIIDFQDIQNLEPAIDYHIMRLYLRTGRVIPSNEIIFKFLEGAPNPRGSLVRELRRTTAEAAKLTSFYSGLSVADLNYVEWQIGRSVCLNEGPHCDSVGSELNDAPDVKLLTTGACPYRRTCLSRNELPAFLAFEEPNFISSDY